MRSFTSKANIRSNTVTDLGTAHLGVLSLQPGPPPIGRIAVMPVGYDADDDGTLHSVELGGEFPVGEERWRFVDAGFYENDRFSMVVERIDDPELHLPVPADPPVLRPYGTVGESRLRAAEQALGRSLPPVYRAWLAATNGLRPHGRHAVPGLLFALSEERPLFGVHPQYPPHDLVAGDAMWRAPWLSDEYVAIAAPSGGQIVLALAEGITDAVYYLPEASMTGPPGAAANLVREERLWLLADDIHGFLERLRRYPAQLGRIPANDLE